MAPGFRAGAFGEKILCLALIKVFNNKITKKCFVVNFSKNKAGDGNEKSKHRCLLSFHYLLPKALAKTVDKHLRGIFGQLIRESICTKRGS